MHILTADILENHPNTDRAFDAMHEVLMSLVRDARGITDDRAIDVPHDQAINELGDKAINHLRQQLLEFIDDDDLDWAFANEGAVADMKAFKTKDKLARRKEMLIAWFSAEHAATTAIMAEIDIRAAAREANQPKVATPAPAAKRAASKSITVLDADALQRMRQAAIDSGDTATADAIEQAVAAGQPVIVASPALAKAAKPAKPPKPEPDRFSSMTVPELRAEAKAMFGIDTQMNSIAHLRYRLRQGARAIANGEKPTWDQPPNAVRVSLQLAKRAADTAFVMHRWATAAGESDASERALAVHTELVELISKATSKT